MLDTPIVYKLPKFCVRILNKERVIKLNIETIYFTFPTNR